MTEKTDSVPSVPCARTAIRRTPSVSSGSPKSAAIRPPSWMPPRTASRNSGRVRRGTSRSGADSPFRRESDGIVGMSSPERARRILEGGADDRRNVHAEEKHHGRERRRGDDPEKGLPCPGGHPCVSRETLRHGEDCCCHADEDDRQEDQVRDRHSSSALVQRGLEDRELAQERTEWRRAG